jgi:hypothetical protein
MQFQSFSAKARRPKRKEAAKLISAIRPHLPHNKRPAKSRMNPFPPVIPQLSAGRRAAQSWKVMGRMPMPRHVKTRPFSCSSLRLCAFALHPSSLFPSRTSLHARESGVTPSGNASLMGGTGHGGNVFSRQDAKAPRMFSIRFLVVFGPWPLSEKSPIPHLARLGALSLATRNRGATSLRKKIRQSG